MYIKRHALEYSEKLYQYSKKKKETEKQPQYPLKRWINKLKHLCKLEYDTAKKTNLIKIISSEKAKGLINIIYRKFVYKQS